MFIFPLLNKYKIIFIPLLFYPNFKKKVRVYCLTSDCPSVHSIFLMNYIRRISEIRFQGWYYSAILYDGFLDTSLKNVFVTLYFQRDGGIISEQQLKFDLPTFSLLPVFACLIFLCTLMSNIFVISCPTFYIPLLDNLFHIVFSYRLRRKR